MDRPLLRIEKPLPHGYGYGDLRQIAADLRRIVPYASSITLIDLESAPGDITCLFPIRYRILAGEPLELEKKITLVAGSDAVRVDIAGHLPRIIADPALRSAALAQPYIWVANGGAAASRLLATDLPAGFSILLRQEDEKFIIAETWPIGHPSGRSYHSALAEAVRGRSATNKADHSFLRL